MKGNYLRSLGWLARGVLICESRSCQARGLEVEFRPLLNREVRTEWALPTPEGSFGVFGNLERLHYRGVLISHAMVAGVALACLSAAGNPWRCTAISLRGIKGNMAVRIKFVSRSIRHKCLGRDLACHLARSGCEVSALGAAFLCDGGQLNVG